jgi:GNAT superfamily N-acetyltransferase
VFEVFADRVADVMALGVSFFAEGKLPGALDTAVAERNWRMLIESGAGAIFAIRGADGRVVGALGALIYPDLNDGALVATEAFWYVLPEHRGSGLRLLQTFETWAQARGARRLIMVHLSGLMPDKLETFYQRRGYRAIEKHYLKEV